MRTFLLRWGLPAASVLVSAALVLTGVAPVASAQTPTRTYVVHRDGPDVVVPVHVPATGEAVLDLTVAAPGTDWAVEGAESAVLSVFVGREYASDVVVTGAAGSERTVGLGELRRGGHVLWLRLADARSAAAAEKVVVERLAVSTYAPGDPGHLAARFTPILHGRNLANLGDAHQNAVTDTPLLAFHEAGPGSRPGHTRLTYSVIWSNEDGGTNSPALMARWGRTTDIEWVYAVEVDESGERVPGSDVYHGPDHETRPFTGRYDGDHPLLQTCTSNNNLCDVVDNPMRFALSAAQTLPPGKAREFLMDTNPWTYLLMAKESIREGKVEPPSPETPFTEEVSDQRNYLYAVLEKRTDRENSGADWVGVALGVRLRDGDTVYSSHHGRADWSIQRDVPAATTVELPAGTTPSDIVEVTARRVVVGTDTGATVRVTGIQRGFLLGPDYLPGESFLSWSGDVALTAEQPTAVLW
ncbi:MAG TPA: hypothetical protein VI076_14880, partial [Actinopolymorphaceae bacterium]